MEEGATDEEHMWPLEGGKGMETHCPARAGEGTNLPTA